MVAVAVAIVGCAPREPSPSNLRVELRSDKVLYVLPDDFSGTLTYINKSCWKVEKTFGSLGRYHMDFYDSTGTAQLRLFPNHECQALSYLKLGPFETYVDTLRLALHYGYDSLPVGTFRVRAWVEDHEDIYSETMIEVR